MLSWHKPTFIHKLGCLLCIMLLWSGTDSWRCRWQMHVPGYSPLD